jgi:hypothetical protein
MFSYFHLLPNATMLSIFYGKISGNLFWQFLFLCGYIYMRFLRFSFLMSGQVEINVLSYLPYHPTQKIKTGKKLYHSI